VSVTSCGDDDGIDAGFEPVDGLVEFLSQQQRLNAQPVTARTQHHQQFTITPHTHTFVSLTLKCH